MTDELRSARSAERAALVALAAAEERLAQVTAQRDVLAAVVQEAIAEVGHDAERTVEWRAYLIAATEGETA